MIQWVDYVNSHTMNYLQLCFRIRDNNVECSCWTSNLVFASNEDWNGSLSR